MERKLKFGIFGCGMIANFHAEALKNIDEAELVCAADNKIECAEVFAKKYGIKACGSYKELLENADAVCICTPSGLHAEGAAEALEKGKHVVLEKPMALTSEEADRVIDISRKSGGFLTVISQLRFSEDVQRVKKLVDENAFGKLIFCDLYMKYYRTEEYFRSSAWKGTFKFDGGGALMNQGIHGVDLLQYIVGEPKIIKGKVKTLSHDVEVEDTAVAMLEFKNGAIGVIEASTCAYPGFERKIEIIGDKGYVVLTENKITEIMLNGKKSINKKEKSEKNSANDPTAISYEMHRRQLLNFINAINGKEALLIDASEGRKAVKIIEDIYKSSKNNM
ncbi:MAG: Gfo/Idh/MocA family protein [Monoglobaceae bacterium]